MLTRRQLAPALVGLSVKAERRLEGGFVFESQDRGHRLRDRAPAPVPREKLRVPVVIVGGGIAGLSAAWWLHRNGFRDFVLLEMEYEAGGNARSGENEISAYPWSAHYLPIPGENALLVRELCRDLGLLSPEGRWDERWLCHAPQERLFIHGRWQEGLEPHLGMTREDARQFERFFRRMEEFRGTGEFRTPMENGLCRAFHLDRLTMGDWMRSEGFFSSPLRWLVDYSCRDDYGTVAEEISAWAGIHYFASRPEHEQGPLTWPEGNGWIVRRLLTRFADRIRTGAMVHGIRRAGNRWQVFAGSAAWECEAVIFAAPTFLASWLVDPPPPNWPFDTCPWLIANLTLDRLPANKGADPAWENILYHSAGLGYVDATHQTLRTHKAHAVWTYYHALASGRGADQRRILLGGDWRWWTEWILADLEKAHPDIRACVRRVDIFRNGHAMPKPRPGFLRSAERLRRVRIDSTLIYANSDLSGLSLFEEAQWRGVEAARRVLRLAGGRR